VTTSRWTRLLQKLTDFVLPTLDLQFSSLLLTLLIQDQALTSNPKSLWVWQSQRMQNVKCMGKKLTKTLLSFPSKVLRASLQRKLLRMLTPALDKTQLAPLFTIQIRIPWNLLQTKMISQVQRLKENYLSLWIKERTFCVRERTQDQANTTMLKLTLPRILTQEGRTQFSSVRCQIARTQKTETPVYLDPAIILRKQ